MDVKRLYEHENEYILIIPNLARAHDVKARNADVIIPVAANYVAIVGTYFRVFLACNLSTHWTS